MGIRVLLLCCFLLLGKNISHAQTSRSYPITISFFNNATLLPGAGELGIFGLPIHPGLRIGTAFTLQQKSKSQWFQTAQVGYFYHRYVHQAIQLYSETAYRYDLSSHWDIEGLLGLGYLHAIPSTPTFRLKDGQYEKRTKWGRAQLMGGLTLGIGYHIEPNWRIFIQSQFYLQTPFVKEYVTILPNLAFHTGFSFPLVLKSKS